MIFFVFDRDKKKAYSLSKKKMKDFEPLINYPLLTMYMCYDSRSPISMGQDRHH
jgi:hypothetical protein